MAAYACDNRVLSKQKTPILEPNFGPRNIWWAVLEKFSHIELFNTEIRIRLKWSSKDVKFFSESACTMLFSSFVYHIWSFKPLLWFDVQKVDTSSACFIFLPKVKFWVALNTFFFTLYWSWCLVIATRNKMSPYNEEKLVIKVDLARFADYEFICPRQR